MADEFDVEAMLEAPYRNESTENGKSKKYDSDEDEGKSKR